MAANTDDLDHTSIYHRGPDGKTSPLSCILSLVCDLKKINYCSKWESQVGQDKTAVKRTEDVKRETIV